jgi:hypothetical protein
MTPLTAALDCVTRGLAVLPVWPPLPGHGCSCPQGARCSWPGKHPRVVWKRYQIERPTAEQVETWWTWWPEANLGIVTGMVSHLCALDVDPRNGGFDTLAELDAVGALMPEDNPLAESGGTGLHHYFRLTDPLPKSAPFEGIELQADGGYIVVPPSLHHSGRRYRWLRDLTHQLPPLPSWLRWAAETTTTPADAAPPRPHPSAASDDVLGACHRGGLYIAPHRKAGLHRIRCPWAEEHSNGDAEAVVREPDLRGGWGFKCMHSHCAARRIGDLLDHLDIPRRAA